METEDASPPGVFSRVGQALPKTPSVFRRLHDGRKADAGAGAGDAPKPKVVSRIGLRPRKKMRGYKKPKMDVMAARKEMMPDELEEYNIPKMEERAEKLSDVPTLKRRARRFDEETANELVQVREAKLKNLRIKRFKEDEKSSSEDSDDDDVDDNFETSVSGNPEF